MSGFAQESDSEESFAERDRRYMEEQEKFYSNKEFLPPEDEVEDAEAILYQPEKKSTFSVYGRFHTMTDVVGSSDVKKMELSSEYAIYADLRFFRIFSLTFSGGQSTDSNRQYFGLGLKADVPGLFFVGGELKDLAHKRRRRDINTYFIWSAFMVNDNARNTSSLANRYGGGIDFFLWSDTFLNLELAFFTYNGNTFISSAAGLGWEF